MKEIACDARPIEDFLADELDEATRTEFETHLAECEVCQRQLTESAAAPEMWSETIELLGGDSEVMDPAGCETRDGSKQVLSVLDSLTPTDDPTMLGRLGEYEISGVIGIGGMGGVLKGYDRSLRRVVAIKVMAPHLADNGSARQRFQREARAAAAITHDNVIDIYGVAEAAGLPYLVMPFARGPSLQKRLDESGPMSLTEVLRIGRQIASGLSAAHEQGLVHRDIKPANILLNDGIERLWITDFGVARAMDDASMTQTGVIAGTPQYMSPEQARGEAVDHRSDLFSLGSILYTAFTGRPPFRAETTFGILRKITDTDPRDLREINPDVPDWMCHVIDRLMAKHPGDRFQSAEEVAELLEACLAHLQQPMSVPLPQNLRRVSLTAPNHSGPISKFVRNGVLAMVALFGVALLLVQVTSAPDVSGTWKGDVWTSVTLEKGGANDWYSGRVTDVEGRTGMLQLRWSRVQQRFNGQFQIGEGEFGDITFRRGRAGKLSGAVSLAPGATADQSTPRLREFVWVTPNGSTEEDPVAESKLRKELARLTETNAMLRTKVREEQQNREKLFAQTLELRDRLNEDSAVREELANREAMLREVEEALARSLDEKEKRADDGNKRDFADELSVLEVRLDKQMEQAIAQYRASREMVEANKEKVAAEMAKLDAFQQDATAQRRALEAAVALERAALDELNRSQAEAKNQLSRFQQELATNLRILDSRYGHAQNLAELSQRQLEAAKKQFEAGQVPEAKVIEAEKVLLRGKAEIEQIGALIEHFRSLLEAMPKMTPSETVSSEFKSDAGAEAELERKLKVLETYLKETAAKLELAEKSHDRTEKLTKEGIVPKAKLEQAEAELKAVRAQMERLQAEAVYLQKMAEAKEEKETEEKETIED